MLQNLAVFLVVAAVMLKIRFPGVIIIQEPLHSVLQFITTQNGFAFGSLLAGSITFSG